MDPRAEVSADDRSTEEIRRDIEARREAIGRTVTRIEAKVRSSLDWRSHVARRPWVAFGAAAAAGLLAGLVLKRRYGPPRRRPRP